MLNISKNRKVLLFIPGYYGTTLIEKETRRVRWVNILDFYLAQKGIATTVAGTNILADAELVPGDILRHVTLLPYFYKIDSYGKTLNSLQAFADQNQMTLETVSYDWRDDFINSIVLIDQKIKSLGLTEDDELSVVSHSTGALLMSYYLRYGAQDVDQAVENWHGLKFIKKAVLAAAPFHGLMILLRDMEVGTTQGLNRELMSARDYSSFKSSYMFLPPAGEDIGFDLDGKKEMMLNLHQIETWEKNNWGVFKFIDKTQRSAAKTFIANYMDRSQKFHNLLRAPVVLEPPRRIPLFYTWGSGHKTQQNGFISPDKKNPEHKIVNFNLKESYVDGDGTVTKSSGRPLAYFNSLNLILHPSLDSHLAIVAGHAGQKAIQEFILRNIPS